MFVLEATVLTEGIKFLYGQAGEAIKSWRERRHDSGPTTDLVAIASHGSLAGVLDRPTIDFAAMARLEDEIRSLRLALAPYADAVAPEPADPTDDELLAVVDALRQALEVVLGQRITFTGEDRDPTGPLLEGSVDVDRVAGYAAAVRARGIGGRVRGVARANTVEPGGQLIGIDVDGPPSR